MIERPDDAICRGPNRGYSLNHARENFRRHGHMYDPGRGTSYLEAPGQGRRDLMAYVWAVLRNRREPDQVLLDELIARDRESWPWRASSPGASAIEREEMLLKALLRGSRD